MRESKAFVAAFGERRATTNQYSDLVIRLLEGLEETPKTLRSKVLAKQVAEIQNSVRNPKTLQRKHWDYLVTLADLLADISRRPSGATSRRVKRPVSSPRSGSNRIRAQTDCSRARPRIITGLDAENVRRTNPCWNPTLVRPRVSSVRHRLLRNDWRAMRDAAVVSPVATREPGLHQTSRRDRDQAART